MRMRFHMGLLAGVLMMLFSMIVAAETVYGEEDRSHEKSLLSGSSYIIENQSNEQQRIRTSASSSNGDYFDYAVYTGEGEGHRQGVSATRTISIPPGGSAVVTIGSDGGNVTAEWDGAGVSIATTSEPALYHVTVEAGESYEFIWYVNTKSDKKIKVPSTCIQLAINNPMIREFECC